VQGYEVVEVIEASQYLHIGRGRVTRQSGYTINRIYNKHVTLVGGHNILKYTDRMPMQVFNHLCVLSAFHVFIHVICVAI
jgi:hypothetical protein